MTNWRDVLRVHPAAELFPLMGADERCMDIVREHKTKLASVAAQ